VTESYDNLQYESRDGIAFVTIDRPRVLNALDRKTVGELGRAFERAAGDGSVQVVILRGAGERAFAAGADIGELTALSEADGLEFSTEGQAVLNRIESLGKPVIAAIRGYALGGGCELAMACTLRLASEDAVLGQPEVGLGLIPGYGGTQRLPRLVGRGRALELLLTGKTIPAREAFEIGLVDRVVESANLDSEARAVADRIRNNAPLALKYCMEAVDRGLGLNPAEGMGVEAALFARCCATEDMKEGTQAFLEKRGPKFRGQ
jgi:enoyl-CoA hydratase